MGMQAIGMQPAQRHLLAQNGAIPNSQHPALVYCNVLALGTLDLASAFERLFSEHGWPPAWRAGLYTMHHYHSTAHEVLGIFRGWVQARLGGENGPIVTLNTGDVVLIPAGVAHRNEGQSADFSAVGAYPRGMSPDLCYGKEAELARAVRNIARLPVPDPDPVRGGAISDL